MVIETSIVIWGTFSDDQHTFYSLHETILRNLAAYR